MSIVTLLALLFFAERCSGCRVEECALWFQKTKEYESLTAAATERYCQVLHTYLKCMNDTMRFCHGNLRFHSSKLAMGHHWDIFGCNKWESCNDGITNGQQVPINTCYFNPPSSPRKLKYCSLFGDPHLLMFNGTTQTCSEEGARPLIDNRYFLVQITNKNVRGEELTTTVSKITVIVRKHNCTKSLRYEANSDEEGLPRGFVDGTTFQRTNHERNSVEVLWQDHNYVEIGLHFIHSSIHIRRQGPYLSVSVKGPSVVLETDSDITNEMCWSGCRKSSLISQQSAFAAPRQFADCYGRKLHVPKKVAEERCRTANTTDLFYDACVFDLMLTGDDYLVHLAHKAQWDFRRLAPPHFRTQILKNRISLHKNSEISTISNDFPIFDNCIPSFSPKFSPFFKIFATFFLAIIFLI